MNGNIINKIIKQTSSYKVSKHQFAYGKLYMTRKEFIHVLLFLRSHK